MLVEVCANSLESAINAEKAGADRIELCSELGVGGISPSVGLMKLARDKVNIPIHVLIRPRSGNFTYSENDFEVMLADIEHCQKIGMDGIVCGALSKDFKVDEEKTKKLLEATGDLKFTFHRAFDWLKEPVSSFERLQDLGVDYVLTSGYKSSAIEGISLLKELLKKSGTCKVLPGGGINKTNILEFKNAGFVGVHFSAARFHKTLDHVPTISMNSEKFLREDMEAYSDYALIKEMVEKLR